MRKPTIVVALLTLLIVGTLNTDAHARRWRRRGGGVGRALTVKINATLQRVAQRRANAMARVDRLTHGIERFTDAPGIPFSQCTGEGIGMSSSPDNIATCIITNTVVADAKAKSSSGMWYRVRLFN